MIQLKTHHKFSGLHFSRNIKQILKGEKIFAETSRGKHGKEISIAQNLGFYKPSAKFVFHFFVPLSHRFTAGARGDRSLKQHELQAG
jgi:hypothetical protein